MQSTLLRFGRLAISLSAWLFPCGLLAQVAPRDPPCDTRVLLLEGNRRLRASTVHEVLPRPLPTALTRAELDEFERRLSNLEVADEWTVRCEGSTLRVIVREKWTLIPLIDGATGQTLIDSYALLGLNEGNAFGLGANLGGYLAWYERGLNGELWWNDPSQRARAVMFDAGAYSFTSGFRLSPERTWLRRRHGATFAVRFAFSYRSSWRFGVGGEAYLEHIDGAPPRGEPLLGFFVGATARAIYDRYQWNDVTPSGVRLTIEAQPGVFAHSAGAQFRGRITARAQLAHPVNERVALLANIVLSTVNPGKLHHSLLLGSLDGVRGLEDNLLRNAAQLYGNFEVRVAAPIVPRLQVQGVLFADAGGYVPLDEQGNPTGLRAALAVGSGVRLVPTLLSDIVPRFDAGALLLPQVRPFIQVGFSQYF